MSFAAQVKSELCRAALSRKCCAQAEAYGVLLFCNLFSAGEIRIVSECDPFLSRLPLLFKKAFRVEFDRIPRSGETGKRVLSITAPEKLAVIREAYGMEGTGTVANHINFAVLEESCCRQAFLRGAFLAGGSVTDPEKSYHLEFATSHFNVSREAFALMRECGFDPKQATRKANYITYFKRSEAIEDLLTGIGAPLAAMDIMNAKLEKTIRGSVNRQVNCDAANMGKVVDAAQSQIEAIQRLQESGQLDTLPDKWKEAARLRVEFPEEPLAALAGRCCPPVTKSAFNHRLRKLMELAGQEKG